MVVLMALYTCANSHINSSNNAAFVSSQKVGLISRDTKGHKITIWFQAIAPNIRYPRLSPSKGLPNKMKLTTILAATLPVIATASALLGHPGLGDAQPSSLGQWDRSHGQGTGQGPPAGEEGRPPGAEGGHWPGQKPHRDLDTRAGDWMIEECTKGNNDCTQQVVIPAGKVKGDCVESLNPGHYDAKIHIIDTQVLCIYYELAGCKGGQRGPWGNAEKDFSLDAYQDDYFRFRPSSYQCHLYAFGSYVAPVTRIKNEE